MTGRLCCWKPGRSVKTLRSPASAGYPIPVWALRWRTGFTLRNAERLLHVAAYLWHTRQHQERGGDSTRAVGFSLGRICWCKFRHCGVLYFLWSVRSNSVWQHSLLPKNRTGPKSLLKKVLQNSAKLSLRGEERYGVLKTDAPKQRGPWCEFVSAQKKSQLISCQMTRRGSRLLAASIRFRQQKVKVTTEVQTHTHALLQMHQTCPGVIKRLI